MVVRRINKLVYFIGQKFSRKEFTEKKGRISKGLRQFLSGLLYFFEAILLNLFSEIEYIYSCSFPS
jgi:hypothetical protein